MSLLPALHALINGADVPRSIVVCIGCALFALLSSTLVRRTSRIEAPRVGKSPGGKFSFARLATARADFLKNGRELVEEGYAKVRNQRAVRHHGWKRGGEFERLLTLVQYGNSMFTVQTCDMDRLILSNKYIEELRNLPPTILSSIDAQCDRHMAFWNGLDHVKTSQLHAQVSKVQLNQHMG